jgi:hypothetical protein
VVDLEKAADAFQTIACVDCQSLTTWPCEGRDVPVSFYFELIEHAYPIQELHIEICDERKGEPDCCCGISTAVDEPDSKNAREEAADNVNTDGYPPGMAYLSISTIASLYIKPIQCIERKPNLAICIHSGLQLCCCRILRTIRTDGHYRACGLALGSSDGSLISPKPAIVA